MTCHMPKARTIDGNHGVMTDHSIPRTLQTSPPPGAGPLVAFGPAADDRAIGLAYAELQDTRALPYLRRAVPQDWPVRLRLAVLEPDTARATQLYEAVLRNNPHEPATLVNLGALYAQRGSMLRALSFGSERSR